MAKVELITVALRISTAFVPDSVYVHLEPVILTNPEPMRPTDTLLSDGAPVRLNVLKRALYVVNVLPADGCDVRSAVDGKHCPLGENVRG